MNPQNLTLLTDLYELTMMQGYFRHKALNETVVFDMFYRQNPANGGYAIMAGLAQLLDYIENLHFSPADIAYLNSLGIFGADFLSYLEGFRFSGDIHAIPEGTVIFPREPLIKVTAPIMEAQFIETAILNIINHQSLIATKAARVCHAAQGGRVIEFGLRRAQGPDAGVYGARAAMIGGCVGTSNVLCGRLFDVPVLGTHAHSWIMSFPDEYTAFKTYAMMYPESLILLVDTFDSLKSGVPNAIRVFEEMRAAGIPLKNFGIRLDSGDLAYLSKQAREMLDAAGFPTATITASNDLDEYLIESLLAQEAKITTWGVGTHLITSRDDPALGGVYKLAAIRDKEGSFVAKIKRSENMGKVTNPGDKELIRIYDKASGKIRADLICLKNEHFDANEPLLLFSPDEPWKKTLLPGNSYTLRKLLQAVIVQGERVYASPSVMEIRDYCRTELSTLWDETLRFTNPHQVYVDLSQKLYDVKMELLGG